MSRNARNTDPPTSEWAAEGLPHGDRAKVYYQYHKHRALAQFQLDRHLGGHMDGKWRKRRSDLVDDGVLVDSGRTLVNPDTGMEQVVWIMAEDLPHQKPQPQEQPKDEPPAGSFFALP